MFFNKRGLNTLVGYGATNRKTAIYRGTSTIDQFGQCYHKN